MLGTPDPYSKSPCFLQDHFYPISGKDIWTLKDLSAPSGWHLQTVLRNEKHRARKEDSMKRKWVWTKILTLEARESCKSLPILPGSWQAQELRPRASQPQEAHREHLGNAWPSGRDRTCTSHSVRGHVHSWTGAGELMLLVVSFSWMRTFHIIHQHHQDLKKDVT